MKEKVISSGAEFEQIRNDVYLNGKLIGTTENPEFLVSELKKLRSKGELHGEVSISYSDNEVHIWCDGGRTIRPLIKVENGGSKLTEEHIEKLKAGELKWADLVALNVVEYLDAAEEENAYIAQNEEDLTELHTHLEISPLLIFGICAGLIPYLNHNMSTRVTLGANMSKQGIGLYVANFDSRFDTQRHLLYYPQKPILRTTATDIINYDKRASGQNFVVAILSFKGYNMQDALILNKAAIERGLGRSVFYRSYKSEERKYPGGQLDVIEIPSKDVRGYLTEKAYRYLDEDGIISPESLVTDEEVLIGKTSPPRFLEVMEEFGISVSNRRETSVTMRVGECGIVDRVIVSENLDGDKFVKVKVRDTRIPEIGDKFASRHGQKGVVGLIVPQEDMPFTKEGITPDLILNPHAIPSRMTIGQLLEAIAGKLGCLEARSVNGTPFDSEPKEQIRAALEKFGFKSTGKEIMYNGITGEIFEAEIFIGVVYYQKLKHMVSDKIRSRSRGPVQILTRQPTAGKAREGGLRLGEMEKDCLVGHGAALLLKERLLDESDKTVVPICASCGLVAIYDKFKDYGYCTVCGENVDISFVELSYAFMLFLDELKSMGIYPKLVVSEKG